MAGVDVNAPNTQNPLSGANGGAYDTQGRYTFGGITTTGVGGVSSANQGADTTTSYVSMAIIAAVFVAAAFLFFRR
jgi:hypothetical protein